MKKKLWTIVGILAVIQILGLTVSCGAPVNSDESKSKPDSETEKATSEDTSQSADGNIEISWEEAKEYDGQTVTVKGPVVDYFYSEGQEFTSLSIGKSDEGGVLVVLYNKDSTGFPKDMESYYVGKIVSVIGEVSYRSASDVSQININSPEQIKVVSEGDNNIVKDEEVLKDPQLVFSYTDKFPEYWGKIRMVDPLLVIFKNIEIREDNSVVTISGQLEDNTKLSNCFNPEMGVFTTISGLIIDKDGNIKWEQDGYLKGTGSYIKEEETKEFLLVNQTTGILEPEDICIIIAHTEGGMIEDSVMDADKGVFGEYQVIYHP